MNLYLLQFVVCYSLESGSVRDLGGWQKFRGTGNLSDLSTHMGSR